MNAGIANLCNALLFQGAWFACVLGGAAGSSAWGAALVTGLAGFACLREHWRSDLAWAVGAGTIGFGLDSLWIAVGVLDYHGAPVAPAWIVLLWVGVGLTLNHSLGFFAARPRLGGMLAGGTAPLSYLAGERLGAVVVPEPFGLVLVAAVWGLLFYAAFSRVGRAHARRLHEPALPGGTGGPGWSPEASERPGGIGEK